MTAAKVEPESCPAQKEMAIEAYKKCMDSHHDECMAEASKCTATTTTEPPTTTTPEPDNEPCNDCEEKFRTSTVSDADMESYFKQYGGGRRH